MPSIKTIVDEVIDSPIEVNVARNVTPRVKQAEEKAVVSYEQWIANEEEYLLYIYETIQEMNSKCGRQVFDKNTCSFPTFCSIAYTNSFKYKKKDAYIMMRMI